VKDVHLEGVIFGLEGEGKGGGHDQKITKKKTSVRPSNKEKKKADVTLMGKNRERGLVSRTELNNGRVSLELGTDRYWVGPLIVKLGSPPIRETFCKKSFKRD